MHLSLRGWPPLASHAACLLLGASLAHLFASDAAPELRLPARALVLSLPPTALRAAGATTARGAKVQLTAVRAGTACRLLEAPVALLARHPTVVVATELSRLGELARAARAVKASGLLVTDQTAARDLGPCHDEPRVVYGERE